MPNEIVVDVADVRRIADCVLPERQLRVWRCQWVDQLTAEETAQRLGCSLRTVQYERAAANKAMDEACVHKRFGTVRAGHTICRNGESEFVTDPVLASALRSEERRNKNNPRAA